MEGNCERAVGAIGEIGERDLGRVKGFLLERHTRRCGSCASYMHRMGTVVNGLSRLGRVYAPEDLVETVMACLVTTDPGIEDNNAVEHHGRRNLVLMVGAAGIGVGTAVGLAIARWVIGREHPDSLAPAGSA
jgi:hypothetical protein